MARHPEEVRESVRETRRELEFSIGDLKSKIAELTDWKKQLAAHRQEALIGAAAAGFVVGGGIAGIVGLFRR
jgi:phage shock protein A